MPQPKLTLRALEPEDLDKLYIWENSPEMWQFGYSPAPLSRHQLWQYIETYNSDPIASGQLRLMITLEGQPIGCIDLYNIDIRNRHAFVGVMISPEYRRNGYASTALTKLINYTRCNLGLNQIAATIACDNAPSLRLFEKCGFKQVSRLPQWLRRPGETFADALVMNCLLRPTADTDSNIEK